MLQTNENLGIAVARVRLMERLSASEAVSRNTSHLIYG
jgi:hypothetical protein